MSPIQAFRDIDSASLARAEGSPCASFVLVLVTALEPFCDMADDGLARAASEGWFEFCRPRAVTGRTEEGIGLRLWASLPNAPASGDEASFGESLVLALSL